MSKPKFLVILVFLTVLTVLAIGFVVFVVVADQIIEREPIVRRDEIDAGRGRTSTGLIKIGAAGESKTHFADSITVSTRSTASTSI